MRVTIGSPIYERPEPAFVTCLISLLDELRERGHTVDWRYSSAVVHWSRNHLMADMMKHEPDVLVQLDADMQWDPLDVVDAIETVAEEEADVIGFAYLDRKPPSAHQPPGWVSPAGIAARTGFMRNDKHYLDVDTVGGGILVTSRRCIERMAEGRPRQHLGAPMVFDFPGELGEDGAFCQRWREMGGRVYCDVTSLVGHIGSRVYAMNPQNLLYQLDITENEA